jgi:hypothetical protein
LFFADLTPYEYGREEPRSNVLNVGWLSREHSFPTGGVSDAFINVLRRLVASPVNLYRGYHICEFCPEPSEFLGPTGLRMIDPPKDTMGNGEIRVVGSNGLVYVAPALVAHYVEAHNYSPPAEFIRAVLSIDDIASA